MKFSLDFILMYFIWKYSENESTQLSTALCCVNSVLAEVKSKISGAFQ